MIIGKEGENMSFALAYRSKSNKYSYLTAHNTFKFDVNAEEVIHFSKKKNVRKYVKKSMTKAILDRILLTHSAQNFNIIDIDTNEIIEPLFKNEEISTFTLKNNQPEELTLTSVNELVQKLNEIRDNAVIMDLEFYQDRRPGYENVQHVKQIAAIFLGDNSDIFNEYVFDGQLMNDTNQLEFLKRTDMSYSEASNISIKYVMNEFVDFLNEHNVETIISWGNSHDFYVLNTADCLKMLKNFTALDIEKVLAKVNCKSKDPDGYVKMNLQSFCDLLNLTHDGVWHEALADCRMIKKVCKMYTDILYKDQTIND